MMFIDERPDISDLFQAYFDCRKNKRNKKEAIKFEMNFEENLYDLYESLMDQSYKPGEYIYFILLGNKPREVWSSRFRDRIIHHLFYNKFYSRFVNSFIHDSYSCLPGKGTHKAIKRLEKFVRSASNNYSEKCYFLQCDIKNFYMNIDKNVLYEILTEKIHDSWWQWLTKTILFNDPRLNYKCNSPPWKIQRVPSHKRLINKSIHLGLPIGNLSSQFFANIYLNKYDQFCKHKLKTVFYVRYADDVVFLSKCPKFLNTVFKQSQTFLGHSLKLNFHQDKKNLNTVKQGINYVGSVIKPYRKYIRRRTLETLKKINFDVIINPIPVINSYYGAMMQNNSYILRKRLSRTKLKNFLFNDDKFSKTIGEKHYEVR